MNKVVMCVVRSKGKTVKNQKLKIKITMVTNKKKWTVMNPIWRQMKKCNPSNG